MEVVVHLLLLAASGGNVGKGRVKPDFRRIFGSRKETSLDDSTPHSFCLLYHSSIDRASLMCIFAPSTFFFLRSSDCFCRAYGRTVVKREGDTRHKGKNDKEDKDEEEAEKMDASQVRKLAARGNSAEVGKDRNLLHEKQVFGAP